MNSIQSSKIANASGRITTSRPAVACGHFLVLGHCVVLGRGAALAACLLALTTGSGCSVFRKPSAAAPNSEASPLRGNEQAEVFQRIREAKSQNAVVLQVAGDSTPIRVLPLPSGGQAVFVSDLLKQTGVQDKLGAVRATLYRSTPEMPSGVPLEVKFAGQSGAIRPESDYALQAGDRLRVAKQEQSAFGGMFDQLLPANATRAVRGY